MEIICDSNQSYYPRAVRSLKIPIVAELPFTRFFPRLPLF
jgi:hypothetical protein